MILSGSLHGTARPVLLVVTFPTQVYSNKFAQFYYYKITWCCGLTLANSWHTVDLKVVRFIII